MTLARLKAETDDLHRATESTDLARALVERTVTLAQYAALLAFHARVHAALEGAVAADTRARGVAGEGPSRAARAAADLQKLDAGDDAERAGAAAAAPIEQLLASATGPRLIGMLYVLEGASLGGVVLAPRIAVALGLAPEHTTFFRGAGMATSTRWAAFKERLDAALDPADVDEAVAAARALFAAFPPAYDVIRESVPDDDLRPASLAAIPHVAT